MYSNFITPPDFVEEDMNNVDANTENVEEYPDFTPSIDHS
jgi:hypothetical protein